MKHRRHSRFFTTTLEPSSAVTMRMLCARSGVPSLGHATGPTCFGKAHPHNKPSNAIVRYFFTAKLSARIPVYLRHNASLKAPPAQVSNTDLVLRCRASPLERAGAVNMTTLPKPASTAAPRDRAQPEFDGPEIHFSSSSAPAMSRSSAGSPSTRMAFTVSCA